MCVFMCVSANDEYSWEPEAVRSHWKRKSGRQGNREKRESERGHRGKRQKKRIVILAKVVS